MKDKICPKCHSSVPWDGLGWTCEVCGYSIEPNPEEVKEAVQEALRGRAGEEMHDIYR